MPHMPPTSSSRGVHRHSDRVCETKRKKLASFGYARICDFTTSCPVWGGQRPDSRCTSTTCCHFYPKRENARPSMLRDYGGYSVYLNPRMSITYP
ncbi:hypothetical protein EVAR_58459_1 [Eumeta japonica]|uniref:Uncharacterized protein n=1 Tax=Eumeta variegata TaxID=151549 RepID=A0A4C1Z2N1_EUMVA|nr:hypothetical protein EVAR_58459_1 [Eumeta japonica]